MMDAQQVTQARLPIPATLISGSDRYACQVVARQASGRTVWVTLSADPGAPVEQFTLRKDGKYRRPGRPVRGHWLSIGHAEDYRDPHL